MNTQQLSVLINMGIELTQQIKNAEEALKEVKAKLLEAATPLLEDKKTVVFQSNLGIAQIQKAVSWNIPDVNILFDKGMGEFVEEKISYSLSQEGKKAVESNGNLIDLLKKVETTRFTFKGKDTI